MAPRCTAQFLTAHDQDIIDLSEPAVVKIKVDGVGPDDSSKHSEGSWFFIYSGNRVSFLLTAFHVIGSSETEQKKNFDWKVENGVVSRKIVLEARNEHGALITLGGRVDVAPTGGQEFDIALLMIKQDGYSTLPLADELIDKIPVHTVALLGYQSGQEELTVPISIGSGQLDSPTKYVTSVPSRFGESGGPWIDLQSGRVFAVAREVRSAPTGPSNEATPVTLIKPWLIPYFQHASLQPANSSPLKILASDGQSTIAVAGSWGSVSKTAASLADFGPQIVAVAHGSESSECDSGSGRTASQAEARSLISLISDGLRFEYSLGADGGHYRTAATCLGNLPIGLTGHDTTAEARATMQGELKFEVGSAGIAVKWNEMPTSGASYKIVSDKGTEIKSGEMSAVGQSIIQDLPPGRYELKAYLTDGIANTGASSGGKRVNATVSMTPLQVQ
jgi:hypothetical protein